MNLGQEKPLRHDSGAYSSRDMGQGSQVPGGTATRDQPRPGGSRRRPSTPARRAHHPRAPRGPPRRPPPLTRKRCWCRRRRPRTPCCGGPRPARSLGLRSRRRAAPPVRPCPPAQGTPAAVPPRLCAHPSAWRQPSRSAPRLDPTHSGSPRGRAAHGARSAGKGSRRSHGGVLGEQGLGAARKGWAVPCGTCSPCGRAAGHAGSRSLRRRGSEAVLAGKDAASLLGNRSPLAG